MRSWYSYQVDRDEIWTNRSTSTPSGGRERQQQKKSWAVYIQLHWTVDYTFWITLPFWLWFQNEWSRLHDMCNKKGCKPLGSGQGDSKPPRQGKAHMNATQGIPLRAWELVLLCSRETGIMGRPPVLSLLITLLTCFLVLSGAIPISSNVFTYLNCSASFRWTLLCLCVCSTMQRGFVWPAHPFLRVVQDSKGCPCKRLMVRCHWWKAAAL
jgi:hypothetical protein